MNNKQPQISVIVCSIKPEMAKAFCENVEQTIGVAHEMIVFDNRQAGKGICEVYNECAAKAAGEYLLFVHEDVVFYTQNWGEIIIKQLNEPSCGVIGFAGSAVKYGYEYGWQGVRHFTHKNYLAGGKAKGKNLRQSPHSQDFVPVVCLDGMALFVRKNVWAECPFDAVTFAGFHSYDTDFTTQTHHAGYTNYVCHSVTMEHLSLGSFSVAWYESVKCYLNKWALKLPMCASSVRGEAEVKRYAVATEAFALKMLIKNRIIDNQEAKRRLLDLVKQHPLNIRPYVLIAKFGKRLWM